MILFSTLLDIQDTLTKDVFIQLVILWNQGSPHKKDRIESMEWNGERNIRFGDERVWMEIQEYRNQNIIAVRYEKTDEEGVVWDTDFIMNYRDWKMSIQLDRSFLAQALTVESSFSTPHFITMLARGGYLRRDGGIPTGIYPTFIDTENLSLLGDVVLGTGHHHLPVVYVSKAGNTDPVNVKRLAFRLKGVAHVLVQKGDWVGERICELCGGKNEEQGEVGIYFPNPAVPPVRFHSQEREGYEALLADKIVRTVINYANCQLMDKLYTWQGVNNALLRDKWMSRGEDLTLLEQEKSRVEELRDLAEQKRAQAIEEKNFAEKLVDSTDEEISDLKRRIEALTHENERLTAENAGLRSKISGMDSQPILFQGSEEEFFPGEIKDIVLCALEAAAGGMKASRRKDVLGDIVQSNHPEHLLEARGEQLKIKLRGYKTMSGSLRQFLEGYGFCLTDGGKHYRMTYRGDGRYYTTVPKSGSDYRGGKNLASEIIEIML